MFEFVVLKDFKGLSDLINIVFWALLCFFVLIRLHYTKDKNYQKYNSIRLIIICLFSALIIIYALGLFLGYTKNVLSLKPLNIIKNILPVIILIITEEIIRYIIARNSFFNKKPIIILTILYIILNIIIEINNYNFYNLEQVFKFICTIILPLIATESLYSYIAYKIGLGPNLLLRMAIEIFPFVLPFYPALGDYLSAIFGIALPYFIYVLLEKNTQYQNKSNDYVRKVRRKLLLLPIGIVLVVLIALVSGIFTHKLIAIGSNSMVPVFARGDAVLYTQYKKDGEYEKAKVGDILVFKRNNVIVTHCIVRISVINFKTYFKTKGDNNEVEDSFDVPSDDVLGVINYRIKYIGFPTIWLSESFAKENN